MYYVIVVLLTTLVVTIIYDCMGLINPRELGENLNHLNEERNSPEKYNKYLTEIYDHLTEEHKNLRENYRDVEIALGEKREDYNKLEARLQFITLELGLEHHLEIKDIPARTVIEKRVKGVH